MFVPRYRLLSAYRGGVEAEDLADVHLVDARIPPSSPVEDCCSPSSFDLKARQRQNNDPFLHQRWNISQCTSSPDECVQNYARAGVGRLVGGVVSSERDRGLERKLAGQPHHWARSAW